MHIALWCWASRFTCKELVIHTSFVCFLCVKPAVSHTSIISISYVIIVLESPEKWTDASFLFSILKMMELVRLLYYWHIEISRKINLISLILLLILLLRIICVLGIIRLVWWEVKVIAESLNILGEHNLCFIVGVYWWLLHMLTVLRFNLRRELLLILVILMRTYILVCILGCLKLIKSIELCGECITNVALNRLSDLWGISEVSWLLNRYLLIGLYLSVLSIYPCK